MKKSYLIWLFVVFGLLFGVMGFLSWRNPYVVSVESENIFLPGFVPTVVGIFIIAVVALLILIGER